MVDRQAVLPTRVRVALAVLVIATLVPLRFSAGRIVAYLRKAPIPEDAITQHDRRLVSVREALMAMGVTEIGYLPRTQLRAQGAALWPSDSHYLATRYALAPVMVRLDAHDALVFADLAVEPTPGGAIPGDLEEVRRFDGALVLLQRTQR